MPVAKGPKFDARSGVLFGGLAVLAALAIGFIAIQLGGSTNRLVLGDTEFGSINADNIAAEIAENGPILWPDVGNGDRDIWLQHSGESPADGWTAFDARNAGVGRECNVMWSATNREFADPCTGTVFPSTGEGLPQIPVFIDVRELVIDINGIHSAEDFEGYIE